jgi:aspartate carbamoyltransferase catalytic subunit
MTIEPPPSPPNAALFRAKRKAILGMAELSLPEITGILDRARMLFEGGFAVPRKLSPLNQRTVINLFFETSTRTQTSFELAAKRLGADVVNIHVEHSAIKKGETLLDTAMTLNAMNPWVIIVRHPASGAVHLLAQHVHCGIINAGDGMHEHPTQALLDALTIQLAKGQVRGLEVAICGDVLHSRVARSNIILLRKLGANVRVIAPPSLMPSHIAEFGAKPFSDMREGLRDADVVMMLRVQKERMQGSFFPSPREYAHFYGLDAEKLKLAKPDAIVLHPGPINRGVEIDSAIADDMSRSLIHRQVELGVAVRMACLESVATYLLQRGQKVSILRKGA